jgi:hypothetical protein
MDRCVLPVNFLIRDESPLPAVRKWRLSTIQGKNPGMDSRSILIRYDLSTLLPSIEPTHMLPVYGTRRGLRPFAFVHADVY